MMRPAMLAVRPGFRPPPAAPFCADDTGPSMAIAISSTSRGARTLIGTIPLSAPTLYRLHRAVGEACFQDVRGRIRQAGAKNYTVERGFPCWLVVGGWATNIGGVRRALQFGLVAMAVLAGLAPIDPGTVERRFSTAIYPAIQRALTPVSNVTPFALFDLL